MRVLYLKAIVLKAIIAAAILLGSGHTADAISIYIDFPVTAGGNGAPSSTFGAAAGLAGVWNNIEYNENFTTNLLDTSGTPSGVTLRNFNPGTASGVSSGAAGDDGLLLNDSLDHGTGFTVTIRDLPAGLYDFYTYSYYPAASTAVISSISVDGQTPQLVQRTGSFAGYALGETHALHRVNHDGVGDIVIAATAVNLSSLINGLQIVEAVPEPSTLFLAGAGCAALCLAACYRRRRTGK